MAIVTCKISNTDIVWTDLSEPTNEELLQVSTQYNLNRYTLTDSQDPDHLPKYEEHNDIHFFIVRMVRRDRGAEQNVHSLSSKIAVFYNDTFIVTIHRCAQELLQQIRESYIDEGKTITTAGIAVRIIKDTLHTYDGPAKQLSDDIDFFESKLFLKKKFPTNMIRAIYFLKSRSSIYRKLLLLTNEVVSSVKADGEDKPAIRDVHDLHTKLLTLYDQIQDEANNLLNIYLSLSAQKTNDVMKILTIFSVFFMPLTFIVGVYGMNFRFMPELNHPYGYPIAMFVLILVSIVIFIWFKRKDWL